MVYLRETLQVLDYDEISNCSWRLSSRADGDHIVTFSTTETEKMMSSSNVILTVLIVAIQAWLGE